MRAIERTGRFKRDYKREKKADPSIDKILVPALNLLATDAELPESMRDHGLAGEWKGSRDCHLRPDLVLIYRKPKGALSLVRLGSHAELFG
jgi:mRNA interferase YafQ